jgi:hypothetical protein
MRVERRVLVLLAADFHAAGVPAARAVNHYDQGGFPSNHRTRWPIPVMALPHAVGVGESAR